MRETIGDSPTRLTYELEPTAEERIMVASMVAVGQPLAIIARCVRDPVEDKPISVAQLKKYFAREIETSTAIAAEQIGRTIFNAAMNGDTQAALAWMKARGGWHDKQIIEHHTAEVQAIAGEPEQDTLEHLSDEELKYLEQILTKTAVN